MLLLYAKSKNGVSQALKPILNGGSPGASMETYANLDDLFDRLRKPRLNLKIGILSIGNEKELDRLLSIRELLADMRLVVVLPDKDPQTVAKAHALAPRFITFADAGIEPLVSVVNKMVGCRTARVTSPPAAIDAVYS
jgi:DNA-binding NarL/FixJ family response regulator